MEGTNIRKYYRKRKRFFDYIAGFVDADGSFTVSIKKGETKWGYAVDPEFKISVRKEDAEVLYLIKEALQCGKIYRKPGSKQLMLVVKDKRTLKEKILPFFRKHPLIVKQKEYKIFSEIVERLNRKEHLTREGFIEILKLAKELRRLHRKGRSVYNIDRIIRKIRGAPQRPYAGRPESGGEPRKGR